MKKNTVRSESITAKKKKVLKKAVLILIIIFAVLLAIYFAAGFILKKTIDSDKPVLQTEDDYITKSFRSYYPEDYDADLSKDSEYMSLSRDLMYFDSTGAGFSLEDMPKEQTNEAQRFFLEYFTSIIGGDYSKYPSMFTSTYASDTVGFEKHLDRTFTPQRIYDVVITELGRTDKADDSYEYEGKKCVFGFYEVSYKILKNDGTFRRDLPENATRPLIVELVTFGCDTPEEITQIKNLYTANSVTGETVHPENDDFDSADE